MADKTTQFNAIRIFAWSLLVNGAIGFVSIVVALKAAPTEPVSLMVVSLTVPLLGLISGSFAFRSHFGAIIAGLLFYAAQLVRYYSPSFNLAFMSGVHFDVTFPSNDHVVALNLFAMAFLALGAVATNQHLTLRSTRTLRDDSALHRFP